VERVCDRVAFVKAGRVESIETTRAAETLARVLGVRWSAATARETLAPERLTAIASTVGAEWIDSLPHAARFSVRDDEGAARLLEALLAAGVRVTEAVPEGSRLERLFAEPPPLATGTA
jgi:hypothetical protein